jgi:hypothetical protein
VKAYRVLFWAAFTANICWGQVSTAPPYKVGALELQPGNDWLCSVTPIVPVLTFDFTFHSGYEVSMPMKTLDPANKLTVAYRATARDQNNHLTYFLRAVSSSSIDWDGATGTFKDMFALGEGRYHIDWSLEDQHSHVCATSWDTEAALTPKEAAVRPWIQPTRVQPVEATVFERQPQIERKFERDLLQLDIIVNFAPQDPRASVLKDQDLAGLVGILRTIARDPHIREYSLVACSVEAQKILFRQAGVDRIDFPGLAEALKSLRLGTVDLKQLLRKDGPAQFVASILSKEPKKQRSDALIIVGPKLNPQAQMSRQLLESLQEESQPIFYLNYHVKPEMIPWGDIIGKIVKKRRGVEYTISRPMDLIKAWSDVIAGLVDAKHADKTGATPAAGF